MPTHSGPRETPAVGFSGDRAGTLIAAVESVRRGLNDGAAESESRRTLSEATVDALRAAGLFAMKVPAALGGLEADLLAQIQAIEALAQIDASAAWCTMVGASAIAWPAAFLPNEAIAEMFQNGVPMAAAAVQPTGRATRVDGGYHLAGRWSFASGIQHAEWLVAGAVLQPPEGPLGLMLVFPRAAATIVDDWHSSGLQATGSCGFTVEGLFVSEAFSWIFPHARPRRGGPMYHLGWPGFVIHEPAAFALGIGRRALDELTRIEQQRSSRRTAVTWRDSTCRDLGHAALRLRSVRALVQETFAAAWDVVSAGRSPAPKLQAEMRGVAALATEIALDVTAMAFRGGGSSAVYRSNILQLLLRDIQAASQHWLVRQTAFGTYGQFVVDIAGADPIADAR